MYQQTYRNSNPQEKETRSCPNADQRAPSPASTQRGGAVTPESVMFSDIGAGGLRRKNNTSPALCGLVFSKLQHRETKPKPTTATLLGGGKKAGAQDIPGSGIRGTRHQKGGSCRGAQGNHWAPSSGQTLSRVCACAGRDSGGPTCGRRPRWAPDTRQM